MRKKFSLLVMIFGIFFLSKIDVNAEETFKVKTLEEYYTAIETIHASSNGTFTIILENDIDINDASKVKNNTTIDNGNTVTIIGGNHKIHFSLGGPGRFHISNATLNLSTEGADSTLTIEGAGTEIAAQDSILTINNGTVNMYEGVTLKDNRSGSSGLNGGAVRLGNNGRFIMNGGLIKNNSSETSSAGGGAIMIDDAGEFIMNNGVISDNYAGSWGGAVLVYMTGSVTINGGVFKNNEAAYGGAIASIDRPITIKNATFEGNKATYGGAVLNYDYYGGTTFTIDKCNFYNNSATTRGGAIVGWGTGLTVTNSTITANAAGNGGGVYLSSGTCDLSTTSVYNNKATTKGNDYFIAADATASIINASSMTGHATYGDINTNLLNWYVDAEGNRYVVDNPTDIVNVSSITTGNEYALTAAGNPLYTVTFETNGGSSIDSQLLEAGGKVTKPQDPTSQGKVFVNWYSDEELTNVYDFNTPVTSSIKLYAKWEEVEYEFTSGANQTHMKGEKKTATFKINADYSLFETDGKVYVDDVLIDSKNYTSKKEGTSTIIILNEDFLNSLKLGEHTIRVIFSDNGQAITKFKVMTDNPPTGDNIILYTSVLILSIAGLIWIGNYIRKRKFN